MGRRLLPLAVLALAAGCATGGTDMTTLNAATRTYAQLADTLHQLYDKCMADKGFTVHPRHEPADRVTRKPPTDRPENLAQARKYGYAIETPLPSSANDPATHPDPFDEQPEEVRRAYSDALTGTGSFNRAEKRVAGEKEREFLVMPDGNTQFVYRHGCQPETDRAVFGDVRRSVELRYTATSGLDHAVYQAAATAPETRAARADWSSCMSDKGYPGMTDTVDAARKAVAYYRNLDRNDQAAVRRAQDREIAQAVAHVECADRTEVNQKLTAAWHPALSAYLTEHGPDLTAWRESSETALTRARQLLAE